MKGRKMKQSEYTKKALLYGNYFIQQYEHRKKKYEQLLKALHNFQNYVEEIEPKEIVKHLENFNRMINHQRVWRTHDKMFDDEDKFLELYEKISFILKEEIRKRPYISSKSKKGKKIIRQKKARNNRGNRKSRNR